ncbi:MAG: DNA polymerase [Candidatus Bathyarchaeia archaeon]
MHNIKHNKQTRTPSIMVFYDTETEPLRIDERTIHRLKLGVARYVRMIKGKKVRDKYFVFKKPMDFWDWLEKKTEPRKRLWLISHNQHFDFNVICGFEELVNRRWNIEKMVLESDVFIVRARKEDRKILAVDSTNYFKTSIAELGKQIGLPKLEIDFNKASEEELLTYCKRDVEILSEYFLRFINWWKESDLGNFSVSVASLAFNAYKHRFMRHKIVVHDRKEALELEINSYRGGRNECFYIGEINEKVYKLDVNSLYPYVMANCWFPFRLRGIKENITPKQLFAYLRYHLAIADVLVETKENAYGVKREKLIFPIGRFRVTLVTPELWYALKNKHLIDIYKVALYDPAPLFREYVEYFYGLKKQAEEEGNHVKRTFAKLMLNSLYGKFAQRTHELEKMQFPVVLKWGSLLIRDIVAKENYKVYFINGEPYRIGKEEKLFYDANVAIASHVTAYGRMYLWELMKKAGLENIYYVDTDSLFVNQQGYERLKEYIGDDIGKLKVEDEADKVIIYAPKDYVFGDEVKIKGIKPTSIKVSTDTYITEQFLKTKSLLSKSFINCAVTEDRIKQLKRQYDKGIVHPNGCVSPLILYDPA